MTLLLLAQLRFEESMIGYIVISLFFILLSSVVIFVVTNIGRRLILLGLLMLIASIGYGLVATPSAVAVAPTLGKVGGLLVFGGMVHWLLAAESDRSRTRRPGQPIGQAPVGPAPSDLADNPFESED